ncbi:MAG: hypothetical protein ABIZ34_09460 [Candidatus Limnocylindrales bacterium]
MNEIDWLLDSDPSLRWQVLRDLTDSSTDGVAAERSKVATEGWGARLLALQARDGQWGGSTYMQEWTSTAWALSLLRDLGLDPDSEHARNAVALVSEHGRWEHENEPFFEGEVEPCINGLAVAIGAYFGQDMRPVVERLLGEQLEDGGWNCQTENGATVSSFGTTIAVLEGLLQYEQSTGASAVVTGARERAHEYLLERRLFRRKSTGEVIDPDFTRFAFPTFYFYDVLRGLDYLRSAGVPPDERAAEAIELVRSKREAGGRWPLEHVHEGAMPVEIDDGVGRPSRWNTLRAMRVLRWAETG